MLGPTHQLIGITTVFCAGVLLVPEIGTLNTQTIIASVILSSIGSLTPDLDDEKNKLYTLLPIGRKFASEVIEKILGSHRSFSHSILGISVFGYISYELIYRIPSQNGFNLDALWFSFIASLVMHVFADGLTREGIPLLWPYCYKFKLIPFKFLRIQTGKFFELYIFDTLILLFLAWFIYSYWTFVKVLLGF